MKFYQLKQALSPLINRGIPYATGRTLKPQGYFSREAGKIYKEQYINDAPIFDYFSLMSISQPGPYDWILLDLYTFAEVNVPTILGWLISKKFKDVLEKFIIDVPFKFYESRLMYQEEKFEYYIFQLCSKFYYNINFTNSTWQYSPLGGKFERKEFLKKISTLDEYDYGYDHFEDSALKVYPQKAVLKNYCDLMFMYSIEQFAISERLKDAIIEADIKGLEITPIDHIEFEFEAGIPS